MSVIFINPYRFGVAYDADAQAYFDRVEGVNGDNQPLETAVKDAINAFVVGCKADGIWNAIKASCILAGARTLAGALQPLVGAAPTNVGPFVAGDYNRETGLVGNGSTKYLDSNQNNNADPRDNRHASVYVTVAPSSGPFKTYFSRGGGNNGGSTILQLGSTAISGSSVNHLISKSSGSNNTLPGENNQSTTLGLKGVSRSNGGFHALRSGSSNFIISDTSFAPLSGNIIIFAAVVPFATAHIDARIAFYSIGESLDLALLDARITTLINAFAAAIP